MRYTSGGIISKKLFGYGYYETKAKLWGGTGGLHSSFWSMGLSGGDGINSPQNNTIIELDGYEVDSGRPTSIGTNIHYYVGAHKTVGGVVGTKEYKTVDTSQEEFVFGYEWLPNQINWYLNGEKIRTLKNPLFYGPQNFWLTALGCEAFDRNIDTSLLPGKSEWHYFKYYNIDLVGVNLVVNSSFEYNKNKDFKKSCIRDVSVPVGWYTEGKDLSAVCVYETEDAFEGECVLRHFLEKDYEVKTKLPIPFLPTANYTLSAMVRNPKGSRHIMKAYGFDNNHLETSVQMVIPNTEDGVWQEIKLENIPVNSGECTIAFCSQAEGGSSLEVDEVCFMQTTGENNHTDLNRFEEEIKKPYLKLDDIIIHPILENCGYEEVGSEWGESGLSGFLKGSRYAPCNGKNYVIYKPKINEEGIYEVSFYNVCYENRAKWAKLEVFHKKGIEQIKITQQGESGFIELGAFELDKHSYIKLSYIEGETDGNLAAETVKVEKKQTKALRKILDKSILFKTGKNKVLVEGIWQKIDVKNAKLTTKVINGVIMVPLYFTSTILGAGTFNKDEKINSIDIFYADYMICFKVGSDVVNVKTQDRKMEASCIEENDVIYVPLSELAQAFGKKVYVISSEYALVVKDEILFDIDLDLDLIAKSGL